MKRRKKSESIRTKRGQSIEEDGAIASARVSISDLPIETLMDIHSRLSVKSIFRCRSVCKFWLQILLTSDFAKLHFSRANTCPLLHNPKGQTTSKVLYLLELERDRLCYICVDKSKEAYDEMKFSTRFLIPNLDSNSETKCGKRKFSVVNSCKGLLCLKSSLLKDPIVIYNPVTSEYTLIPSPIEDEESTFHVVVGGLGFCQRINKFKLLVVVRKWTCIPQGNNFREYLPLVYTFGSGIWRKVVNAPRDITSGLTNPIFLNGALHWLVGDFNFNRNFIVYFDLDNEHFKPMLPPKWNTTTRSYQIKSNHLDIVFKDHWNTTNSSYTEKKFIGVLGDQMFVCDTGFDAEHDVWVLKDYGDQQSWFKKFDFPELPLGLYKPIEFFENGDLLLHQEDNGFVICGQYKCRYFKICGFRTDFQVTPHIPSFLSLKEVVGDNMEVLIVRPSESQRKTSQLRLEEDMWGPWGYHPDSSSDD